MQTISILILSVILISCGGDSSNEMGEDGLPVDTKYADGKEVYKSNCVACHMQDGLGLDGVFPPLANSDYLLADPLRALRQVQEGSDEKMIVNGVTYDESMPAQSISDQEAVDVVNYILNAWGNDGGEVTLQDIK